MRRYTKFPSVKLNKIIICQSPVERDYASLMERDIGVKFYKEQPLRIYYWHNGKGHRDTPCFLVQRKSKKQIVEVKHAIQAIQEKHQILFKIMTQICRREAMS